MSDWLAQLLCVVLAVAIVPAGFIFALAYTTRAYCKHLKEEKVLIDRFSSERKIISDHFIKLLEDMNARWKNELEQQRQTFLAVVTAKDSEIQRLHEQIARSRNGE